MLIYSHVPDATTPSPPSFWPPLPPSSPKKVATYLNSARKRDFFFFSMDGIKDGNVKVTSHLYPHGVLKLLNLMLYILCKFWQSSKICKHKKHQ